MGKKSGKKSRTDRPDATQGGPRAKVKKERVQPPKSVLRPASAEDAEALTAGETIVTPVPADGDSVEPAQNGKAAKKGKSAKNGRPGENGKPEKKAKTGKRAQRAKEGGSDQAVGVDEPVEDTKKAKSKGKPKVEGLTEDTDTVKARAEARADAKSKSAKAAKPEKNAKAQKTAKAEKTAQTAKTAKAAKVARAAKAGWAPNGAETASEPAPDQEATSPTTQLPTESARKTSESAPTRGTKASAKDRKGAGASKDTPEAAGLLSDESDEAHGFARLIRAMPGIVALVEQHDTAVHRAVFDSYVTAVVEFGADAADLAPIDIRTASPDAVAALGAAPAATGRSGSGAASSKQTGAVRAGRTRRPSGINSAEATATPQAAPASGAQEAAAPSVPGKPEPEQVRSPRSSVRASTRARAGQGRTPAPKAAADSAAQGRTGTTPIASRARASSRSGSASRPRAAAAPARSLEELSAALKPTNNGQRIAIAISSIAGANGEVSAANITAEFERMTWRVPVNVAASVRQAARAGLVELEGPTGTRLTPAGERYVAGD